VTRSAAISQATAQYDSGAFLDTLNRRVAYKTESQEADSGDVLHSYLADEMTPALAALGFTSRIVPNPVPGGGPFLIAQRHESDDVPTVLTYGHGDVVRGYDAQWRDGLKPWEIVVEGDRWYGRGTADNKGQHTINLSALAEVLALRGGKLGYNVKMIVEMGEEMGSPGLHAICEQLRDELRADVLIASDGPRLAAQRPTVFLGSRGLVNFKLSLNLLGKLGRTVAQSRGGAGERDCIDCRWQRQDSRRWLASARGAGVGASRAGWVGSGRRTERSRGRR